MLCCTINMCVLEEMLLLVVSMWINSHTMKRSINLWHVSCHPAIYWLGREQKKKKIWHLTFSIHCLRNCRQYPWMIPDTTTEQQYYNYSSTLQIANVKPWLHDCIVLLYKMTLFGFKSESAEVIPSVGLFPVCSLSSRYFN